MSYTWSDDSLKLLALDATERMNIMLRSLEEIYQAWTSAATSSRAR
ncbi:hypothetical protein N806_29400 [Rhodococcus sp. P27]|nr:hypothetical protein N806_29400 [Rhodococcus sp. P27]